MRRLAAILMLGLLAALPAEALEYRSVIEPALLYDAPSQQGKPLFAIARGTPVESVVTLDTWVKVLDAKGNLAWIEKRLLSEKHNVMVRAERAQVRVQADDEAVVVFEAERDVLLEFIENGPLGWARVRHRDGRQGFVKSTQVWGF
jgi:SH3-like domain-containing protein